MHLVTRCLVKALLVPHNMSTGDKRLKSFSKSRHDYKNGDQEFLSNSQIAQTTVWTSDETFRLQESENSILADNYTGFAHHINRRHCVEKSLRKES